MARYIQVERSGNPTETEVCRILQKSLPDSWLVIGNYTIRQGNTHRECDIIVLNDKHSGYVIEVKNWSGDIYVGAGEWTLKETGKKTKSPIEAAELQAKMLHTKTSKQCPSVNIYFNAFVVLTQHGTLNFDNDDLARCVCFADEIVSRLMADSAKYTGGDLSPAMQEKFVDSVISRQKANELSAAREKAELRAKSSKTPKQSSSKRGKEIKRQLLPKKLWIIIAVIIAIFFAIAFPHIALVVLIVFVVAVVAKKILRIMDDY